MECRETKDKEAKTKGRENKGGRKGRNRIVSRQKK